MFDSEKSPVPAPPAIGRIEKVVEEAENESDSEENILSSHSNSHVGNEPGAGIKEFHPGEDLARFTHAPPPPQEADTIELGDKEHLEDIMDDTEKSEIQLINNAFKEGFV